MASPHLIGSLNNQGDAQLVSSHLAFSGNVCKTTPTDVAVGQQDPNNSRTSSDACLQPSGALPLAAVGIACNIIASKSTLNKDPARGEPSSLHVRCPARTTFNVTDTTVLSNVARLSSIHGELHSSVEEDSHLGDQLYFGSRKFISSFDIKRVTKIRYGILTTGHGNIDI